MFVSQKSETLPKEWMALPGETHREWLDRLEKLTGQPVKYQLLSLSLNPPSSPPSGSPDQKNP